MKEKVIAKQVEEAKKAERKRRHLIEDLRYAIKRVEPAISLEASYEDVSPLSCRPRLVCPFVALTELSPLPRLATSLSPRSRT